MNKLKLPSMNKQEIEHTIQNQFLCRIAFQGKHSPYIAPFQYAYLGGQLYFHFTDYGDKMTFLEKGNTVCVEIEAYTPNFSEYAFVTLTGTLEPVTSEDERKQAIQQMAETGQATLSSNFLYAHGFEKPIDWSDFTPNQPILILKLGKVTSTKGLKSP